jgi:ligand-binding SRPBCC domain-containing protein
MQTVTSTLIHALERSQFLKADPGRVWEFFSNPRNLNELAPADR